MTRPRKMTLMSFVLSALVLCFPVIVTAGVSLLLLWG